MVMEKKSEWKLIASEQLLKDNWIDVRSETWEKPDGKIITPFYKYGFPDYATALAITKEGKVVLEKVFRQGVGLTSIELPGGCIDPTDDSITDAMARELLEETGYRFEKIEWLGKISPNPTTNTNYMHMFLATGGVFDPEQTLDVEEEVEVLLVSMDELIVLMQSHQFIQSMQLSTLFFALQKLGRVVVK
jgi:8-oxo-dGTP pyrophosphatase MutT (NUDIX family)